jgi:lysophospholipase L1-like esterase
MDARNPRLPSFTGVAFALAAFGAIGLSRCPRAPAADPAPPPAPAAAPAPPIRELSQAGAGAADGAPPSAELAGSKQACVVLAIGDSLTDARAHGGKYLDHLRERCPNSRFYNLGKGGDMVNQMRRRFTGELQADAGRFTHVIVFGGVNDVMSNLTAGRTPKLIGQDLSAIYALARERGAKVVAVTLTPWSGFTRFYDAARADATHAVNAFIAEKQRAGEIDHVADAYALLSCGDREALCPSYAAPFKDGLHFGPEGHKKLGEALYQQAFADCL